MPLEPNTPSAASGSVPSASGVVSIGSSPTTAYSCHPVSVATRDALGHLVAARREHPADPAAPHDVADVDRLDVALGLRQPRAHRGVDAEPLGAHQHLALAGLRDGLGVVDEVLLLHQPLGSLGEQDTAVRRRCSHEAGPYLTPRQVICSGCGPGSATSRRGGAPRRPGAAAAVGGAPRLVGRGVAERDDADRPPPVGHAERGQHGRLVVEQAEEARAQAERPPRRAGRARRPCPRRPTSTGTGHAPRPGAEARRRLVGLGVALHPRVGPHQHHEQCRGADEARPAEPGPPLAGQGDVPVAGRLLGPSRATKAQPWLFPADGARRARSTSGSIVPVRQRVGRERPHHPPAADGVAQLQRATGWELGELGEVFGHGPAEGDERVAPLGVEALEEGGDVGADGLGLQAVVVEHLGVRCRCPWPRTCGRRRRRSRRRSAWPGAGPRPAPRRWRGGRDGARRRGGCGTPRSPTAS